MADNASDSPSAPRPEQVRAAAGQFERAQEVVASGNLDYAIRLLRSCCQLDPSNLVYRQTLRRTVRARYRNNMRGAWLAWLWNIPTRMSLKRALRQEDHRAALDLAERILARNPWDFGAQVDLGTAAEELGWLEMATWSLEQARTRQPQSVPVITQLALLYEKQQNFEQATGLWRLVTKLDPSHPDAVRKLHQLAASETIQRGGYQQTVEKGGSLRNQLEDEQVESDEAEQPDPATIHPRAREAALLRQKIEREPQRREHHLALATLYRTIGDLKTARIVLEKGLEATKQAPELQAELLDLEIDPYRQSLAQTEAGLTAEPGNADLRQQRAHLRKEINSREIELYQHWVRSYPQEMRYQYELGVRLLRGGRVDDAIKALQQSRNEARHRWQSLLFLGHCFRSRGNAQLAIRNYQESLQQMPSAETNGRKEALYFLASLRAAAGELTAAIEHGTELANLDFSFRDIGELLDTWQAQVRRAAVSG